MDDNLTHGQRVKASILAVGVELWVEGVSNVTARQIGKVLGLTHSAVLYHFTNADGMRAAIASEAVRRGDRRVVPQLIASRHPAIEGMTADDRQRYLAGC